MKKGKLYKILSITSFFVSLFFMLNSEVNIVGSFVGVGLSSGTSSLLAMLFLLVSGFLFVARSREVESLEKRVQKQKRQIAQEIRSGKMGSYKDLVSHSKKIGLVVRAGPKHWDVYDRNGKKKITEIPMHGRIRTGTYRSVLKAIYASA